MKFIKEHSLFSIIFLVTAILRLFFLFDYQFTYDELSGLERTQFTSFADLIDKGVKIDAHPALVQLIIYYLVQLFGYVTWIIKLPFLLFSLAILPYAYFFGLRHFSKQSGLFATVIFSFSLVFVFYAPIARMYISGVFFSMALLYYFFEIFFLKNLQIKNFILLGLFALLSALNQHINALFALSVCASGLFFLTKANCKHYLITVILVVLAYLPHLSVSLYQLGVGGIGREQGGWLDKPDWTVLLSFTKMLLGTGKSYLVFLVLIVIGCISSKKISLSKKQVFLLTLFLINFLIVFLYSYYRASIYQHSVMLFAGVALVFFFTAFYDLENKFILYPSLAVVFALLFYKSYIKKDYLHQSVKTVYEYQFERTLFYKTKFGADHVYPVFFDADAIMKKIYFGKYQTQFDCTVSADPGTPSMHAFSRLVAGLKSDYLVLSSSLPAQDALARQYFPYLLENTQTQAVNFKLYSKRKSDETLQVPGDEVLLSSDPVNKGTFDYGNLKTSDQVFTLSLDSLNEFPLTAKARYADLHIQEGEVLLMEAKFKAINKNPSMLEDCIALNDEKNNFNYGYAAKSSADFVMNVDSSLVVFSDYYFGTNHLKIKDHTVISAYLWNKGHEKATLVNYQLKLINYWPNKWRFWD